MIEKTIYECDVCKTPYLFKNKAKDCNSTPVIHDILTPGFVFQINPKGCVIYQEPTFIISLQGGEFKEIKRIPNAKNYDQGIVYGVITGKHRPSSQEHIQRYHIMALASDYLTNKTLRDKEIDNEGLPIDELAYQGFIHGNADFLLPIITPIFNEIKDGLEFWVNSHFVAREIKEKLTLTNKR